MTTLHNYIDATWTRSTNKWFFGSGWGTSPNYCQSGYRNAYSENKATDEIEFGFDTSPQQATSIFFNML